MVLNAAFVPQPGFEADPFSGLNVLETNVFTISRRARAFIRYDAANFNHYR